MNKTETEAQFGTRQRTKANKIQKKRHRAEQNTSKLKKTKTKTKQKPEKNQK